MTGAGATSVWVVVGLAAAVAAVGAGLWFSGVIKPDRIAFAERCEEVLLDRLRSPTTYRRVELHELRRRPATLNEYMGWTTAEDRAEDERLARRNATLRELQEDRMARFNEGVDELVYMVIEYDAANGFGVPIRGRAECSAIADPGTALSDVGRYGGLRINGDTAFDWAMRGLRG